MKLPRPASVFSFARTVSAITLIFAAITMTFIAASSGSAPSHDIATLRGKIAAENQKHGPDIPAKSRGQGHGPKLVWLKIMAFTDAPVVGADVSVSMQSSRGRPFVEVKGATNNRGVFPVALRGKPSFLRVSVSGGTTNGNPFPGHLSADVVLTDPVPQIVIVNPVTTLVGRVLDERPNLKLDSAEALVRRFLQLPPNYSLGLALRQSSRYRSPFFSPVALLKEAQAAGGLDAFQDVLLQELLSSVTHSFRGPKPPGDSDDPEVWIAENLASGALSYAEGEGVGWIMAQTGLPTFGATSDSIDDLENALVDLASAIDDLANEVAQLNLEVKATATQTQYTVITTTAATYATTIQSQYNDLQFFAQYCPPLPEGSTPPATPDQYCIDNLPLVISELQEEYTQAYYEQVEELVQDNGTLGLEGMLHLYSLWLGEAKPFWRAADSTAMQNLYDYWDTILTAAADMRMELFHYLGDQNTPGGTAQITAFMGNPDVSPPTDGTFQTNQDVNQSLMFPALTSPNVFVNTTDHMMWSMNPWNVTDSTCRTCTIQPSPSCSQTTYPAYISTQLVLSNYEGFTNWGFNPTKSQWQNLVSRAPASSSGTDWHDWLISQTQAEDPESPISPGFFSTQSCGNPAAWTATDNQGNNFDHSTSEWYVIQLKNDSFQLEVETSNSNYFNWPIRALASGEQYYWYQ